MKQCGIKHIQSLLDGARILHNIYKQKNFQIKVSLQYADPANNASVAAC